MGKFPDIFGESEQCDLPSANFDKPAQEVPLYLIAELVHSIQEVSENDTSLPGYISKKC